MAGKRSSSDERLIRGRAIVQEPLARIPWYHHIALLEKLDDPAARICDLIEAAMLDAAIPVNLKEPGYVT